MQPRVLMSCGSAAREPLKTPPALVAITFSQSAGFVLATSFPAKTPALFTRMSRRPNSRIAMPTVASMSASFATSATLVRVRSRGSSEATPAMFFRWWPTSTTAAPSRERKCAVASPMPEPAPVTITTLPAKRAIPPPST